ncbi:hypothetical protein GT347_20315 [Xylophilus rhododendri]|uniref:Uncharacterized protein n=1 Tax=Xylophilus rhododendri TaxID=2697032 RepID=A0A857J8C7_9BURK|nr:hypothetical protein [Xylophilus rhododendri]QHJ00117.1 hypothetical protein GT347_20315 [Xylophilus rhododendri]
MTTQLQALHAFTSPEGDFAAGATFEVEDKDRVKFLIDGCYAKQITKTEAKAIAEASTGSDA